MKKLTGLWIGKAGDANCWYYIYPYAVSEHTERLHVVRYKKPERPIPNVTYHFFKPCLILLDIASMFLKGYSVLRRHKIDYVVTYNPVPWGTVAWILAKLFSKPIIVGFIGSDFLHSSNTWYKGFLHYLVKKSNFITTTGSVMDQYFKNIGIDQQKLHVYPHCVHDDWINSLPRSQFDYHLITVSDLIKRKRIGDIIHALYMVQDKLGKDIKLCVVGRGPEMPALRKLSGELGLQDSVIFTGYSTNVRAYFKKSSIYVQASDHEGLSISLVEAMAEGLVPVATRAGAEVDIIKDGINGFLVDIGFPQQIAEKLLVLLSNKEDFTAMQQQVIISQRQFRIENAIHVCDKMLEKIME